jgi:hypothetical protein
MYSIKLDINDKIYEKVMFFLENIPKQDLTIKEIKNFDDNQKKTNLVEFFRNSPLVGEIEIKRYPYINA